MFINSIKITVAAAIVIFATNVLAGCTPSGTSKVGMERIETAQEMKKVIVLSLIELEDEEEATLRLTLKNPENKPITSVQSWLAYNPDFLKGVTVDTKYSDFELVAPYDNDFDNDLGLVMIGRSSAIPVTETEIVVADIHFDRLTDGVAMIEAYDYRHDLEGHTSANMMVDSVPMNVLLKPESPLLILN